MLAPFLGTLDWARSVQLQIHSGGETYETAIDLCDGVGGDDGISSFGANENFRRAYVRKTARGNRHIGCRRQAGTHDVVDEEHVQVVEADGNGRRKNDGLNFHRVL